MDTARALTGWILFVLMAILAAFFWHQSDARGKRIEELTVRISEIDAQINRLTSDIIELRENLTTAETLYENPAIPGSLPSGDTTAPVQSAPDPAAPPQP